MQDDTFSWTDGSPYVYRERNEAAKCKDATLRGMTITRVITRWSFTEYVYSNLTNNKNIKTSKEISCKLLHLHFMQDPLWVSIGCNENLIDSWICKRPINITQRKYYAYKQQTTYSFLTICKKAFIFFSNSCYTVTHSELGQQCKNHQQISVHHTKCKRMIII